MPTYNFFVPKQANKPLTIPKSPNFALKERQSLQRRINTFYLLPELSFEAMQMSPDTDGGSFLDTSTQTNNLNPEEDYTTTNDETEEDKTQ